MPVNSYTLTFRKKIVISSLLILGILIILDIGLYFVANMKSTKTTFINDKFSKSTHFKLNSLKKRDIIFVGSSRTFYHISTNTFKKNGLDIYNLGVSGAQFEDYPTFIPYVNEANPKQVVISLSVHRLFSELGISAYPTVDEISYYYDIDKIKFLESLKQWVVNRHLFLQYSEPIFYKIKSLYEKFESPKISNNQSLLTNNSIDYSKLVGCTVFDIKETTKSQTTLKCTNGDGVLIGNHIELDKLDSAKKLEVLNQQSVEYLQKIIGDIDLKDTKVSIILEPILHNRYEYNIDDIKKQFKGIRIIDLTNLKIEDSLWSDNGHLNYKGREEYSQYLFEIF